MAVCWKRFSLGPSWHVITKQKKSVFSFSNHIEFVFCSCTTCTYRLCCYTGFRIKELLDEVFWDTVLRDIGMEKRWQLFKDIFLRGQDFSIPQHGKSSRGGKKTARLNKDLMVRLKEKKMYRQ